MECPALTTLTHDSSNPFSLDLNPFFRERRGKNPYKLTAFRSVVVKHYIMPVLFPPTHYAIVLHIYNLN
jgi:hypothetical protein